MFWILHRCFEYTNPTIDIWNNGYLKNLYLSSLISLRNGSVLGTNIRISIFRWIKNEYSRSNIKCAVKETLQLSLIPVFFGTPCIYLPNKWFALLALIHIITTSFFTGLRPAQKLLRESCQKRITIKDFLKVYYLHRCC